MFRPSCTGYIYQFKDFSQLLLQGSKMTVKEKRKKMVAILSELKEPLSEFDLDFINEMRKVDSLLINIRTFRLGFNHGNGLFPKTHERSYYSKTDAGQYNSQTDKEQFQDWLQIQMLTDSF